jgi:hypothetical protein
MQRAGATKATQGKTNREKHHADTRQPRQREIRHRHRGGARSPRLFLAQRVHVFARAYTTQIASLMAIVERPRGTTEYIVRLREGRLRRREPPCRNGISKYSL